MPIVHTARCDHCRTERPAPNASLPYAWVEVVDVAAVQVVLCQTCSGEWEALKTRHFIERRDFFIRSVHEPLESPAPVDSSDAAPF